MSYPWPSDLQDKKQSAARQISAQRLHFEPLESRILLSAEIGIPPNDPMADELMKDRFTMLESRYLEAIQQPEAAIENVVARPMPSAAALYSFGAKPTPEIPLEWVLPSQRLVEPDTGPAARSQFAGLNWLVDSSQRQFRAEPVDGELMQARGQALQEEAALETAGPVAAKMTPTPLDEADFAARYGRADFMSDRPGKFPSVGADDAAGLTVLPVTLDGGKGGPIIVQDLIPPPGADGPILGTINDDTLENSAFNNDYEGLAGDDVYEFIDGWGNDSVTELGSEGTDTLDFSAVTAPLTFTINADGTIAVTDGANTVAVSANVENIIGGFGNDIINVAAGASINIDGGDGNDSLIVDGNGLAFTGSTSSSLVFENNPASTIVHSRMEIVQVDNSVVDLTVADLQQLSTGLHTLANRMGELGSIAGFDESIPLADPLGATFGDLVNFSRVMDQLASDFDDQFLTPAAAATSTDVIDFLLGWIDVNLHDPNSADYVSGTSEWMANTLAASDQVLVDAAGVAALRFTQQLSSNRDIDVDLNLSDTLSDQSVAVARETLFSFVSGFELDHTFGLADIFSGSADRFFVDEVLDLAATAGLSGGPAASFVADALIGFVDGTVDIQLTELSAVTNIGLAASGGSWMQSELDTQNPFNILSETGVIDVDLDFDTGAGFEAGVADIADGLIGLASSNFLTDDLAVTLPGNSEDFTFISPNELLRMLDQLGGWLSGLAQSEILDLSVPFAGNTTIGDLLDFGEAFGEELMRHLVHLDGLRLSADLLANGQLPGVGIVNFGLEVEIAGVPQVFDIALDPADTTTNTTAEHLLADVINAVDAAVGSTLAGEIDVFLEEGRIGFRPMANASTVAGVSMPSIGNESLGFEGNSLIVPTSVFESGMLGHELEFTLNVDGIEHTITVARNAANGDFSELVDDINLALLNEFDVDSDSIPNVQVIVDPSAIQELVFELSPIAINADGSSIGSVILDGVRDSSSLVDGLLSLGVEEAAFFSAQDLADRLSSILSDLNNQVTVEVQFSGSEMSFDVLFDRDFVIADLPLDLSVDLGDFIELESSADLGADADVALGFTFGVDLDPSGSLVVAPPVAVPDLPDAGQLLEQASFNFTLLQENFQADERLNGGTLNVGDWSVTANGSAASVVWAAPDTGRLFHSDPDGDPQVNNVPDTNHHFFIEVTDNNGKVTFVDAILLSFDTDENANFADLASDLEDSMILALASRGFAGLQVSISAATKDDFQISAAGTGFNGYQLRLVTEVEFEVAQVENVSVSVADTSGNGTLEELLEDLQNSISNATTLAGLERIDDTLLGLTGPTSIGDQGAIVGDVEVPQNGVLSRDVHFEILVNNVTYRGVVSADSTIDNEQENENEPDPIAELATDVEFAINAAITDQAVTVTVNATSDQRLEYSINVTNADLHFFTPAVIAEFTGQRFGVFAVPVLVQPDSDNPSRLLARRITVDAEFDNSAFEKLGLISSPVPANGILRNTATFQIVVDDVSHTIVVNPTTTNTSVDHLINDINDALLAEFGNTDVQVRHVMFTAEMSSDGNRIEFVTADDSGIKSLALPALQPDTSNAAISQLGFSTDEEYSASIQNGEFFIRGATLSGGLNLDATDIEASATVGLGGDGGVGIGVEVVDSSGGVFGDVVITLVNPNDGSTQISLGELWDYLGSSDLDLTELVQADITGGVAIDLNVAPVLPIRTPIDPAHIDIDLELPDWLNNPPSLDDASLGNGLSVNISGLDLNIYDALSNLTFSDVTDALQKVVDFLRDLQGDGAGEGGLAEILDEPLPLLNQSPSELLLVADHFAALLDEVIANPADSLGKLESMLEDLLGVPDELVTLALDFDDGLALRVDLQFNAGIQESFGFDLDIASLVDLTADESTARTLLEGVTGLVGVSSTGDLSVGVDGTLRLSFGIALGSGNGSAEALGFKDGDVSQGGVLTASGDAQAAADRLVDQNIDFVLTLDDTDFDVNVMAGDQTSAPVEVDLNTRLSELKDAPDLIAGDDIKITLLDGSDVLIDLGDPDDPNDPDDSPTIADVIAIINLASDDLLAVFSPDLQRILIEDTSDASAGEQSGVYVTQIGVTEFSPIQFSLQVGTGNGPVAVSVNAMSGVTRKEWLAAIDEAIRKAMVDAGQLNPVAAAVVDVAYNGIVNGGQLTFQGTGNGFGERLTIHRGGVFSISDVELVPNAVSSSFADKFGLKGSDDDGDRIIIGKELRTKEDAEPDGLVADVQKAINDAMGLDQSNQVVTVSLLPSEGVGAGRLEFTTDPGSVLEIHSITQLLKPFLYNGTAGTTLDLHAGASGDNLEFTAQVGPFGFFVIDGSANLDAGFAVTLNDNDGKDDGRTYFDQAEGFEIGTSYGGSAIAELPLYFPTESSPVGDEDLEISVPDLLAFLNGADESVVISTPNLTAFPTPTLIGMLSNPEFIIDGLDSVLLTIQDALDGEIYGVDMPLIGDGLAPAGQFISDFREDVLAYLSLKLREGGLNPVTLVQETLYNIFAGEDDGDPFAVRVLGFEPKANDTHILTATAVLTSGMLDRDAELNITVGNGDTTRIVVFAEDITEDTPEALVEAINNSLDGRGLNDSIIRADYEADAAGGFKLIFEATDENDNILIEAAGAIPLDLFGLSVGGLDFLNDATDDIVIDINDILKTGFGLFDEFGQFDFLLGQSTVFGESLDFDLGLPILDFDLDAGVELELGWALGFGFGVSQEDGFYFVADSALAPESMRNPGETGELIISLDVRLLGILGFSPGTGSDIDPADGPVELVGTAELPGDGQLSGDVVFALQVGNDLFESITIRASDTSNNVSASDLVTNIENAINAALGASAALVTAEMVFDADGIATDVLRLVAADGIRLVIYDSATVMGRLGFLQVQAIDGGRDALGQVSSDYSGLGLEIVVDVLDPGSGSNQDGRLSFSEMSSSSTQLSDMIVAEATGGAMVNLGLTVDFGGLDLDASFLPAIGTDLVIDWLVEFSTATGAKIDAPDVAFNQIELDLGSFITDFAGPFLEDIGAFIEPFGFLLDPQDGLLYKRLPVISDLAGQTVTLKQLAELLDVNNKISPFLNALEQIYFLTDLVTTAAGEAAADGGPILLEFGDIMLTGLDQLSEDGGTLADATPDRSGLSQSASDDFNSNSGTSSGNSTPATQSFTRNVTRPGNGSVTFNILQPGTIVDLLLGKPDVTLIEYDLPPFGFDFEYLQRFPIYPPLFATLRGFFSATIDLGFGYDTLGLNQFLATENPLDLVNGFFITDLDANGVDIPELTLYGGIAAGASLDVAVASAGVEGGIDATIYFNLNDPDQDSKVRLSEMLANLLLNYYNPIAIFDTSGKIDAFLRAYVEVLFGLWSAEYEVARVTLASFNIPFARPPVLAQDIGSGDLQLNMGTASANRIHGSLADSNENIWVRYESGSVYVKDSVNGAEQRYTGIDKILVNAGAGNDMIDLRGLAGSGIEVDVRGGTGNDTIWGASGTKNIIFGDAGNDTITGGGSGDEIDGGDGNDTIEALGGDNVILGGAGADRITTGGGNDDIEGGDGDDIIVGGGGDDIYRFRGNWGDDEIMESTGLVGGTDTWDFTGTTTDINFLLGADVRVGSVEMVTRNVDQLRINSTRHGLQTGDQVSLSGIEIHDGSGVAIDLPASATVTVDSDDPDSFTIDIPGLASGDIYVDETGIFQLDRSALIVEEIRASDPDGSEILIQVETDLRHSLQDGDVVYLGGTDSVTGGTVLEPTRYTVTIVDANTFNLDGQTYTDPPFAFANAFVQREETGAGLIAGIAVNNNVATISSANHGLSSGNEISIVGSSVDSLNDMFAVTVVDDDTFQIDMAIPVTAADISTAVWQKTNTRAESLGNTVTNNGYGVEFVVGGRGGDTFDIYQTGIDEVVLDGAGGSDTYRAYAVEPRTGEGANSETRLFDTGDFWDTDVALFFGSESGDEFEVDNTKIVTVLNNPGSADPSFSYGEPNIVVGFQSGSTGDNTIVAGTALESGQLDRDARFLLTVGDTDPVLIVVEPDDVGDPGTVGDLVAAINVAIAASDLATMIEAVEDMSSGESLIAFNVLPANPAVDVTLTIENLSQGSGIEVLEIASLGGVDNIQIGGTNSRTAVTVSGGLDNDFITVGGSDDGSGNLVTVDGIRGSTLTGPLIIEGDEGINSLAVIDVDDGEDDIGTLTDGVVSGLGMQIDIEYSDMSFVSVQLGSGSDIFRIESTIDGTSTLWSGAGEDDVDIETATGSVNVYGEAGADAIRLRTSDAGSTVRIEGGSEADDIDIRSMEGDAFVRGDDGNDIVEIGTMAGLGAPGLLNLVNGQLDISGGSGIDTLIIDDSADGGRSLSARAGLSTTAASNGRLSGDASFELDFGGGDTAQVSVAADIGTLTAANAIASTVQVDGRLTADAFFVLTVGTEKFDILVEPDAGNLTTADLLDDINDALDLVGLDSTRVVARLAGAGDTIVLDSLQGEELHLRVKTGDAAETELGFADRTDAIFDNNSVADLEADINDALLAAGVDGRVSASIDPSDNTLSLTLLSGDSMRVVLDAADPASADLGLANNQLIQPHNVGTLRVNQITGRAELIGLGMGATGDGDPGIVYDRFASVNIALGSGHDEFNVQGTLNDEAPTIQSLTTLSTAGGDDVINVSDTAPSIEADRGHLNGTLDAVQGELSILAGDGHNTLNVSDREATAGDSNVIITSDRIEGLAAGAINYTATSGFAGGVTIWAGEGSDTVEFRSTRTADVTTFHANDGDDRIIMTDVDTATSDGLLILEGGVGDDYIDGSSWNAQLFIFGDLGEVEYIDRTRSLDQITSASTIEIEAGGSDELLGGSVNNLLLGGTMGDTISGGLGDDAVIGDGGLVTFIDGSVVQIGAIDFFVGGDDVLAGGQIRDDADDGGDGNDVIIGGAGLDVLYGTLAEDILIYEYGRVTYQDGFAVSVVVLGQAPLDNAASTMFGLYLKEPFLVSPYHVGDVVSDRPAIDASFVKVSTGGRSHVSAYHESLCASFLAQVTFEPRSAVLASGSNEYLQEAADVLAGFEGVLVHIRGHADSVGDADVNQRLSLERAQSVVAALVGYGVDSGMLRAVGHGEELPIADNATEQGRAENRRVEIELNSGPACNAPEDLADEGAGVIGLLAMAGWRNNRERQQPRENQHINW